VGRAPVNAKTRTKVILTRVGAACSARTVYNLNGVFNYLHVGWWLRAHGLEPEALFSTRDEVFRYIAADIADDDVLYLEFGVRRGASLRRWSELLRNPRSELYGFDSFLGLPHDWSLEGHERGDFSTGGKAPEIDDPRVRFIVGWFDETLPTFDWPEHEGLIVMMDADLYTSTTLVLEHVKERLRPGSHLYFDQFHHRCDELRAFAEFVDENPNFRFTLVAASRDLSNAAFRRLP
jgi:Macrocin-O-methyltransferase (TylF)